ncbi:MAG: GWxTD domain-containing protein [Holophagales bacterium]|nr:MAG: GWxTD domain-containing protein [Holophagales bacterium]
MSPRRQLPWVVLLLAAGCAAPSPRGRQVADLTNPALGPEYAQWLVGAISRLATPEEARRFLALGSDAEAERFVTQFWAQRDPKPATPENEALQLFESRSLEADRLLSESGFRGRRTDRGAVLILFGPPKKVDFEMSPDPRDPPIEVWFYDPGTVGIGGQQARLSYRFIHRGDLTETYRPRSSGGRPGLADAAEPRRSA